MVYLLNQLELTRCPHCNVDRPNLVVQWMVETTGHSGENKRYWKIYRCTTCGGLVTTASSAQNGIMQEIYPKSTEVDDSVPERARTFLNQALNSLHAPAGAVMLAASAVDSMLKAKEYKKGTLYERIDAAAKAHLITEDMAKWAHDVRLDANDQRHADEAAALPSEKDARRAVDFTLALAQFLFVLPSRVQRGLAQPGKSV